MVDTTSSSSSCASFGSSGEEDAAVVAAKPSRGSAATTVKFLCSYGGKILPRYPDGKLRYIGGHTRVLAVDRAIPFSELREKMRELCGWDAVAIRCKLPTEDLDALVSVKSDEDLANVVEEYDLAGRGKIRSFLFPLPPKPSSKGKSPAHPASPLSSAVPIARPFAPAKCCLHQISAPARLSAPASLSGRYANPAAGNFHCHGPHLSHLHHHQHLYGHLPMSKPYNHLVHNGTHRQ